MINDDNKIVGELHNIQEIDFDSPAERKRVLLTILAAITVDQVGRWFDKDREREDPND